MTDRGDSCLHCTASIGAGQGSCADCGFPVAAYRSLRVQIPEVVEQATREQATRDAIEFQNAGGVIRLVDQVGVVVGRGDATVDGFGVQTIRHRGLDERHVAFLSGSLTDQIDKCIWLVDLAANRSSVFVDGCRQSVAKLADGSVIQIGPLAWQYGSAKQVLTPVAPIAGFDLAVDAEVEGRLTRTRLQIRRGEMTALVGPSGCGKSTLLETIRDGSGLAAGIETAGRVFFVPQRDLVHDDLRLGDALRSIGRLYRRDVLPFEIDAVLDSVGLPPNSKTKFPGELSGGQLRRFRIAGALLSGAGVIVLDEPDSGLDHETADEVISLLRSLAVRGATIVAVTHHRHVLGSFDRVIEMRATAAGGAVDQSVECSGVVGASAGAGDGRVELIDHDNDPVSWMSSARRLPILIRRERQKLTSPKLARFSLGPIRVPHLVIGLFLVPLLFALAVAVSVPTDPDRDVADGLYGDMMPITRLGFLAVVSVVWMSASGSHLSITRQREVYDYERSHGLTWGGILLSKSLVLAAAGVLQTLVFAGLLFAVREVWLGRSFFVDERVTQLPGVVLCLLTVSVAATCLGLLVSAVAGRAPLTATAVLPVIMMFQILFSAPFAVSDPDAYEPLADYQQLTLSEGEEVAGNDDDWDEWEDDMDRQKPLWATSLLSYATLSRYGDQWLRSFALTTDPPEGASKVQFVSAASLATISGFCFFASWFVLWMQSTRLGIRRVRIRASVLAVSMASFCGTGIAQDFKRLESDAGTAQAQESITIRLPLVDGRYDENKLRVAMGGRDDDKPIWREFGNQDRIGLVALELVGKIEFTLTDRELTIKLKQTPKWELMKQLAPPRLIGIDQVGDARDVVLFVHGLEGGSGTFAAAAEMLQERGIASMRFDYPNDGPPDQIGRRLAEQMTGFAQGHPNTQIQLVAHSLGGLISTWAVTSEGFPTDRVPNVFTLGTPFLGSALAAFHEELELFDVVYRLASGTPGALNTIADGRGEAAAALDPMSDFLRRLHRRDRPAGIRFHVAAGTKSFLSDSQRDQLVAKLPGELARLAVSPAYAARIDTLLAADELRGGLGDGAVTVRSALGLANPATRKTFPLSHTALVSSVEPLEWVLEVSDLAEPLKPLAK